MTPELDHPSNLYPGNQAPSWAALVVDIINTPEVRRILSDVGTAWLRDWSGSNLLKKGAARPGGWVLSKMRSSASTAELSEVFEKPEHIEALTRQLPTILDHLSAMVHTAAHALEKLPVDRKKDLFNQLFAVQSTSNHGSLLASFSRSAEEIYADDPQFFSSRLIPLIEKWLGQIDFGEVKTLFESGKTDLTVMFSRTAKLLFEYPAKLIAMLVMVPDAVNLMVSLLNTVLEELNALPPDILTDLMLTLTRQVDAAAIGQSVNRINETIRQLHTGSTLIGEMDAPRFTTDLREKISIMVGQIDPELAIKARNALIDGRETLISVLIDTAQEHPDYLHLWLQQLAVKRNSNLRLLKQKLQVFETLPEKDADEALSAGLSGWNAYDLAEMVNSLGRTLNRISRVKPGLFPALVAEFVNALDRYELEEALDRFSRDLGDVIRPVFRMAAPPIIRELCTFFKPGQEDDGYDEAMDAARRQLRNLILGKEKP